MAFTYACAEGIELMCGNKTDDSAGEDADGV